MIYDHLFLLIPFLCVYTVQGQASSSDFLAEAVKDIQPDRKGRGRRGEREDEISRRVAIYHYYSSLSYQNTPVTPYCPLLLVKGRD